MMLMMLPVPAWVGKPQATDAHDARLPACAGKDLERPRPLAPMLERSHLSDASSPVLKRPCPSDAYARV